MEAIQIEALDKGFRQTNVYEEIKNSEKEIISDLNGLKEGQDSLRHDVETGFEKGRKRMDGMEKEMGEIKSLLIQSNTDRDRQHGELKEEIRNKELAEIKSELRKKNEDEKKAEARKWDMTKIFLAAAVSAFVTIVIALYVKG